ncbi:nicotinamide riboside kinase 2 isoform X2 [Denticeps clupeoides]|nr:nicotinamide riboside kinase 2-like isoform X2 [Denticeps clupeoides]
MEAMTNTIKGWIANPVKFAKSHGVPALPPSEDPEKDVHILIIEGFLLYNYAPLINIFHKYYYVTIPYDECKNRRSTRSYEIPDPPGLFDGHVWPMYLKHRKEMQNSSITLEYLDGLKTKDEIYNQVYEDINNSLQLCL